MIKSIDWHEVLKKVVISDRVMAVLLHRLAKESKYVKVNCSRNVFLIDSLGEIIWQVSSDFDVDGGLLQTFIMRMVP